VKKRTFDGNFKLPGWTRNKWKDDRKGETLTAKAVLFIRFIASRTVILCYANLFTITYQSVGFSYPVHSICFDQFSCFQ